MIKSKMAANAKIMINIIILAGNNNKLVVNVQQMINPNWLQLYSQFTRRALDQTTPSCSLPKGVSPFLVLASMSAPLFTSISITSGWKTVLQEGSNNYKTKTGNQSEITSFSLVSFQTVHKFNQSDCLHLRLFPILCFVIAWPDWLFPYLSVLKSSPVLLRSFKN